ncbi:MAG: cytidine deaminase [Hungatella sp.]|jgi:cytidine deaminase|nr:cytidine deaminase [Hungatella sp.]
MDKKMLIRKAIETLPNSYVPYSHFHVAAALLCKDGTVYTGINIENAAYTPTICAERSAFFRAVNEGKREFDAIAICGGGNGVITDYVSPCGVCRQVMREFCEPETFRIILAKSEDDYKEFMLNQLLPLGFGPENLQ